MKGIHICKESKPFSNTKACWFYFSLLSNQVLFYSDFKDTEEALMMNLRDSQILNHKQNLEWNWVLIATILKVRPFTCCKTDAHLSILFLSSCSLPVAKCQP